jgi:hypothetical protein
MADVYNLGFGGMNPYTQNAVNSTMGDMAQNYNMTARPQQETSMIHSGSFGNSGLQQMQALQDKGQAQAMGNVAANMQNNAYLGQQQFGLQAQNQQYNQQMGNQTTDFNQGMANKQFSLGEQNQGFNQNLATNQNQFNQGLQTNQFNLGAQNQGFNQGMAQNQNAYNQSMGWANYGLGAQNQQFNQGMTSKNFDANQYWTGQNFDANRFDTGFNQNRQNLSDYMAMMGQANTLGQQDIMNGTNIQNAPLDYFNQFNGQANAIGGYGGTSTSSQNNAANPYVGALGGWQLGSLLSK